MDVILLLIRLSLFGIFALAGVGKLLDRAGSEKAVKEFGVPEDLAQPVAYALPIVEITIGLFLLFASTSWLAATAGLLLLLVFIGGMIYQMAQGNAPDCHCFGQIYSEPVGKTSLIRNIGFAILSLLLVAQGRANQGLDLTGSPNDMLQAVLILGILVLLAVAVFYLKKILDQQLQIAKRIEVLELVSRDGSVAEREGAGNPAESLPLGSLFPDFELADTAGKRVRWADYRKRKRPVLFVFVSPDCGPCNALYPEIKEWRLDLTKEHLYFANSNGHETPVKIGERLPEFSIPDLNGEPVTRETFTGKDSLVLFFSMTCPHCVKMINEIKEWNINKGTHEPNLVVFSEGDPEEHKALDLEAPILLDDGYKLSGEIGMMGTPSGILVNSKGEIVTETGVGASNIWALIGKKRPS